MPDRLIAASTTLTGTGQYNESYQYNAIGNITSKASVTYWYSDTLHKHAATHLGGVQKYWYDANGNMTRRVEMSGTQRITYTQAWDIENRLSVVTNTTTMSVTRFYYDGDGKRVKKVQGGQTMAYLGAHYEKNVTTGVTTTYYYAGSTRVAMRQGSTVYYLHGDHLGSASLTTNVSGNKFSEERYYPYGVTRYGSSPTDRQFTGQRKEDASLGSLYDYGARFYSPVLGRFLSADTIVPSPANPQSLNRYSYVLNSPLKYTDPNGHYPPQPPCFWCNKEFGNVANWPGWAKNIVSVGCFLTIGCHVDENGDIKGPTKQEYLESVANSGGGLAYPAMAVAPEVSALQGTTQKAAQQLESKALSKAGEYGIKPYTQLQKLLNKTGLKAHHIVEKRFASILGLDPNKMSSVALTQEEHQMFTNAWHEAIGRINENKLITTANATQQQIWAAAQKIYADYPKLLEAARKTIFGK